MDVLTRERAKPALPFAGTYQLLDIALSNLANSGVDDVWVSVQYLAGSLDEHLQSGRPWDLDRNRGGYRRVVPQEGAVLQSGFATGNADGLYRMIDDIEYLQPDLVVTVSADQVFTLDLRQVVAGHLDRGAECTVVTTEVSESVARNKAVVVVGDGDRITRIEEKPDEPPSQVISSEIVVFDTRVLAETLSDLRRALEPESDDGDTGLGDLAETLLPALVERGKVYAHPLTGYFRDMGRPEAYLAAHRDLLAGLVKTFDDPAWPMRTNHPDTLPARVQAGAEVEESLLSPGCRIAGVVRRSVLGPCVSVEAGAVVEDCVIFADAVIQAGAKVGTAVVDERATISRGAQVGAVRRGKLRDEDITLVGKDAVIGPEVSLDAGARLEPGTTV